MEAGEIPAQWTGWIDPGYHVSFALSKWFQTDIAVRIHHADFWKPERQVNFFDAMHAFLFVYLASRNPTWSPTVFKWTPAVFVAGLSLHVVADHSKYLFRKDPKNRGRVYTGGVWGLVRHPNFLGFTIWRTAFATAAGGWGFGLLALAMFAYILGGTSVRVLEDYMSRSYGREWKRATEKVRWKMIPGVW